MGLGAEANLSSDDGGAQFAFAAVVIGGDSAVKGQVVMSLGEVAKDILDAANGEVLGELLTDRDDLLF